MAHERQIEQQDKENQYLQEENKNLLNELNILGNMKVKLEETSLELERMCADRDFHNEQHINLRNEILGIVKQEYEVESLKRERAFLQEELNSYKEKALIYEKQIDELTIVAKRPVTQNAVGDKNEERYYAKKIMEVESKYKGICEERDKLKFENTRLKNGLKDTTNHLKTDNHINPEGSYVDADQIASQLEFIKRKNESLKRENDIIRRELNSVKENNFRFQGGDNEMIEAIQAQVELLRKKNTKLEEQLLSQNPGNSNGKMLQMELDEAKKEIQRLRMNTSAGNLNSSINDSKAHNMLRGYLEQIDQLQEENDNLRSKNLNFKIRNE